MDSKRAEEILHSLQVIPVQLNGQSVWIEGVDTENNTVYVQMRDTGEMADNPSERRTVPAEQLHEVE